MSAVRSASSTRPTARGRAWSLLLGLVVALTAAACDTSSTVAPEAAGAKTGYTNVSADRLRSMMAHRDFMLVNVQVPYDGHLDGTDEAIPYYAIVAHLDKLPARKDAKIVLYCRGGHMSEIVARELAKLGYANVWNLEGGMDAWERAGYPVMRRPS